MKKKFIYYIVLLLAGTMYGETVVVNDINEYCSLVAGIKAVLDQNDDPSELVTRVDFVGVITFYEDHKSSLTADQLEFVEPVIKKVREMLVLKAPRIGGLAERQQISVDSRYLATRDEYYRSLVVTGSLNAPGLDSNLYILNTGGTVTGDLTFADQAGIVFEDATDAGTLLLRAPASITDSYVLNFPSADGMPNQALVTDGMGNLSFASSIATTSGIQSINMLTAAHQFFTTGFAGTAPQFNSAVDTNVLNIPLASQPGVTAGLISNANYTAFSMALSPTGGVVTGPLILTSTLVMQSCNEVIFNNSDDSLSIALKAPCQVVSPASVVTIQLPSVQATQQYQVLGNISNPTSGGQLGWITTLTSPQAINLVYSATSANIPGTLVLRDGTGSFAATTVTLTTVVFQAPDLSGAITLAAPNGTTSYEAFLPNSSGSAGYVLVTNGQNPAQLSWNSLTALISGTACDYATSIVARDSTGSFAATTITLTGNSLINYGNSNPQCPGGTPFIEAPLFGNTIIGLGAGNHNSSTGTGNTVFGNATLAAVTSGFNNTAVGANAGSVLLTGSGNIYVGSGAGAGHQGNSSIFLGYSQTYTGDAVNFIGNPAAVIGETAVTTIFGCINLPEVNAGSGYIASFDNNNQLLIARSSKKYKDNITAIAPELSDAVYSLRPVSFSFKNSPATTSFGLIAEDTQAVCPALVIYDEQGNPDSVNYLSTQIFALDALIKQRADIQKLHERCDALTRMLNEQQEIIVSLKGD